MTVPKPNQHSGPMVGHVRKGRVYQSPLAATGTLRINDSFKDDLPDFLWPALVLADREMTVSAGSFGGRRRFTMDSLCTASLRLLRSRWMDA